MAVTTPAKATWDGKHATVRDPKEANRLFKRHSIGEVQAGGVLKLSPVEAAHCLQSGWITVDGVATRLGDLLLGPQGHRLETQFLAYRDLRERGVVVRHEPDGFGVWGRGASPPEAPAYRVVGAAERDPVPVSDLAAWAKEKRVVAVVDDDGEPTYYKLGIGDVKGECPLPSGAPMGMQLSDRVVVDAPQAWAERVRPGTRIPLFLSWVEAQALARLKCLKVPKEDPTPMVDVAVDLWKRGVMPRSGFRFGTHLRGYRSDPAGAHAEFLLHCVRPGEGLQWTDVSRGVRLAHGVRKRFMVAVAGAAVEYVEVEWFKP